MRRAVGEDGRQVEELRRVGVLELVSPDRMYLASNWSAVRAVQANSESVMIAATASPGAAAAPSDK